MLSIPQIPKESLTKWLEQLLFSFIKNPISETQKVEINQPLESRNPTLSPYVIGLHLGLQADHKKFYIAVLLALRSNPTQRYSQWIFTGDKQELLSLNRDFTVIVAKLQQAFDQGFEAIRVQQAGLLPDGRFWKEE